MRLAAGLGLIGLLAAQDLPRAAAALEAGKFDEAVATLSDLLRRAPDDPEANYYMGLAYFRAERPREARPYLERATQLSPARAEASSARTRASEDQRLCAGFPRLGPGVRAQA
jgi:tetratricopeptide (TPR) repeat protein